MSILRLNLFAKLGLALAIGVVAVAASMFFSQLAQAADTVSAAVYQDTNGDGTIDRVRWTMDENVTQCNFESGDWSVGTAGTIGITAVTALSCTGSDAILNITVTASTSVTGGATNPQLSYANAGTAGSVALTSGAMTAKTNQAATDAAAPVVVSTSPGSGVGGILTTANVVITFSEPMDTGFAEATEFTVSPDPGAFAAPSWGAGNTIATLNPSTDLLCGLTYTFTTVEAQIAASAGSVTTLVTTGPQDGDWTFYTLDCGESSDSSDDAGPSVDSVTYDGPVCDQENTHAVTVEGSNIGSYLVSDSAYFTGADWTTLSISAPTDLEVTFDADADTGYIKFRSATSSESSATYDFDLDDWATSCSDDEAPADDEEEPVEDGEEPAEDADDDSSNVVEGVSPGDVIVSSTSTAVYYVTEDYTRRVFLNEQTYFTWYDNFDDVITVSADTMAELPLGPSMLPKAGVVLVKIISSPVVYALEANGDSTDLREIPDEATAIDLYGSAWADYVIDIEPTFFTKFGMGLDVTENFSADLGAMKKRVDLVAM